VQDFSEGLGAVKTGERWGFIDSTGKKIISPKYSDAYPFSEELAAVMLNNKWGFIDKAGKTVIPFRYSEVVNFSEGTAVVMQNNKWGFIDKTGKKIPDKMDDNIQKPATSPKNKTQEQMKTMNKKHTPSQLPDVSQPLKQSGILAGKSVIPLADGTLIATYCSDEGDRGDEYGFGMEPETWMVAHLDENRNFIIPFRELHSLMGNRYGRWDLDQNTKNKIQAMAAQLKRRVIAEMPDYGEFPEIVVSSSVTPFHVVNFKVFIYPANLLIKEFSENERKKRRVFEIVEEIQYGEKCEISKWVAKGNKLKILAALKKMEKDCDSFFD
jgi:hypothetical protein